MNECKWFTNNQTKLTLKERNLMPTRVDLEKAEIPILPHDTVLTPIHNEWRISRRTELRRMCVVNGQTNSLAAEPVGDEICVAEDRTEESIQVSAARERGGRTHP
jgi:hypothetical protein